LLNFKRPSTECSIYVLHQWQFGKPFKSFLVIRHPRQMIGNRWLSVQ